MSECRVTPLSKLKRVSSNTKKNKLRRRPPEWRQQRQTPAPVCAASQKLADLCRVVASGQLRKQPQQRLSIRLRRHDRERRDQRRLVTVLGCRASTTVRLGAAHVFLLSKARIVCPSPGVILPLAFSLPFAGACRIGAVLLMMCVVPIQTKMTMTIRAISHSVCHALRLPASPQPRPEPRAQPHRGKGGRKYEENRSTYFFHRIGE